MQHLKDAIHRLANQLQLILSYIEVEEYTKAMAATRLAVREIRGLSKQLTGICGKIPTGGGIVVPKGTQILSHEQVNIDVAEDEVRTVERSEVLEGSRSKRKYAERGPTLPGEGRGHGGKK
jgi:hypothetical protein